jgi:hypothetical protein
MYGGACWQQEHAWDTKNQLYSTSSPFGNSTPSFLRKLEADVHAWEIVVLQLQKYEKLVGIVYFAHGGWLEG